MTTDAVARFAASWLGLVVWSVVAFTLVERVWPRHADHPSARRVAIASLLLALDAGLAQIIIRIAGVHGGRVVAAWLVAELFHYALHLAMHRVPLLWRIHRVHHQQGPLAWTTAWILHPIDAMLTAGASVAAATVCGAGLPTAAWYVAGRRIWSIVLHANLRWPASPLDMLVATPTFHARHHREDLPPANFAATLPVLDRIFRTYR